MKAVALAFALSTLTPMAALAQTDPPAGTQDETVSQVDEIVVTARRSGAPIWTVTRDGSTLILVGAIRSIPRAVEWRPGDLEETARSADLILTPQVGELSIGDIFRVIWRMRTIGRLPEGRTTADYLDAPTQARLEALMAGERDQGWRTQSLLLLGFDLMKDRAGLGQGPESDDAADIVRRAGRRADIETRPVGTVRGAEMVESLISAPPETHVACVTRAIAAAEAGPDTSRQRAVAWTRRQVAAVVNSPIDQAMARCWPWADADIAPVLHRQWADAIEEALSAPRVTLAVAPIRLLGEPDGILDQLQARGFEIDGPEWRPEPSAD